MSDILKSPTITEPTPNVETNATSTECYAPKSGYLFPGAETNTSEYVVKDTSVDDRTLSQKKDEKTLFF